VTSAEILHTYGKVSFAIPKEKYFRLEIPFKSINEHHIYNITSSFN